MDWNNRYLLLLPTELACSFSGGAGCRAPLSLPTPTLFPIGTCPASNFTPYGLCRVCPPQPHRHRNASSLLCHSDGHLSKPCQWEPAPGLWTETFRKEEASFHWVFQADQLSTAGTAWRGSAWEQGWHKDKRNKRLRTLVTSTEPWIQLYLKLDIVLDFLVAKQWISTSPTKQINFF